MSANMTDLGSLILKRTALPLSVVLAGMTLTAQESLPPDPIPPPVPADADASLEMPLPAGQVAGTGTHFAVTNSDYLNVTLDSAVAIKLSLLSGGNMVEMDFEAIDESPSTLITLKGFQPSTNYYKYQDNYHHAEVLTTDDAGTCSFEQNVTQPHHVFIQTHPSTIFLSDTGWSDGSGNDPGVGTWDPVTFTGTLTNDVHETIQIDSDSVTLDGNGYTASGSGSGYGVYLPGRTNVTVVNLHVDSFTYGIYVSRCTDVVISTNAVASTSYGYYISKSFDVVITDNVVTSSSYGFHLSSVYYLTLSRNTAINNIHGFSGFTIYWGTMTKNTATDNTYGFEVSLVASTLRNNVMSGNACNFRFAAGSSGGNDIDTSNTVDGKPIFYLNNVSDVSIADTDAYGTICVVYSSNVQIRNVTVGSNNYAGVSLQHVDNALIDQVVSTGNRYGVEVRQCSGLCLSNSTAESNSVDGFSIWLYGADTATIMGSSAYNNGNAGFSISEDMYNHSTCDCVIRENTSVGNKYGYTMSRIYPDSGPFTMVNNVARDNWNGILLYSGGYVLRGNVMVNNTANFRVVNAYLATAVNGLAENDIDLSNTVEGKPLLYLSFPIDVLCEQTDDYGEICVIGGYNVHLRNLTFGSNNWAGVYAENTENLTIEGVNAIKNYYGLHLRYCTNCTLMGNNVTDNDACGIFVEYANFLEVLNNLCVGNNDGIAIQYVPSPIVAENTVEGNSYGIGISGSRGVTVVGNVASGNEWYGIMISRTTNGTLSGNVANGNRYGIYLNSICVGNMVASNQVYGNSSYGILFGSACTDNILKGNEVIGPSGTGVRLGHNSDNNKLTKNTLSECGYGILLNYDSNGNEIYDNKIADNYYYGIRLDDNSDNNHIYRNNFINNTYWQASVTSGTGNLFNLDAPIGGNYWSDYTGVDTDGDGFGDTPYVFTGGQDDLPRIHPVGTEPPVITAISYDADADSTLISGTAEPGAIITIYDEYGDIIGQTVADENGYWECELPGDYTDVTISVTATGPGGESPPSQPPAPPVVNLVDYNGSSNETTFSGTAEPSVIIVIYDANGYIICETVADEYGNWTCVIAGDYTNTGISITASDEYGNTSSASQPPEAPVIGFIDYDGTNTAISGTAEHGAVITIYDEYGNVICVTVTDEYGYWECVLSGNYEAVPISVTASDADGNTSSPVEPPESPVIDSVTYNPDTDTLMLSGTAEPGIIIRIYDEAGNLICETVADENGYWQCIVAGDYLDTVFQAVAVDADGNTSGAGDLPTVDLPADQAIQYLVWRVVEMNLHAGIENSLDSKLASALKALEDLKENNDGAAANALQAFINEVQAQRGTKLSDEQVDYLIAFAQSIVDALNCSVDWSQTAVRRQWCLIKAWLPRPRQAGTARLVLM